MKPAKMVRDLADLDKLETRVLRTVNPSPQLLAEIQRRRDLILQGKDPDNATA